MHIMSHLCIFFYKFYLFHVFFILFLELVFRMIKPEEAMVAA